MIKENPNVTFHNAIYDELFKSIFVKIDDCPEWMRERLHQIRNEQLEQETGIHKELNKTVQENG